MVKEITPNELQLMADKGKVISVLDVREPEEVAVSMIEGAVHIPAAQVFDRLNEIDPIGTVVVVCRSGIRSAKVADRLDELGYEAVNLKGGMKAFVALVDPSIPVA
jgi:adenylyltransferase/sulfurtransferase